MRIALVHDYLLKNGGAEVVFRAISRMFDQAPIYTLLHDKSNPDFKELWTRVISSRLQKMPFSTSKHRWYLPFMSSAIESYDLSKYDMVLSSSSAFAKGIITTGNTIHICYCHTPTRYLWLDAYDYLRDLRYPHFFKTIISSYLSYLRIWDKLAADRVDYFIANSKTVQDRITKYYKRDSVVIYPPIDINKFLLAKKPDKYFLAGGRLVPYKRFDLIVTAFNRMRIPLKIFGTGPELAFLKSIASSNIEFLGEVSEDVKRKLYQSAQAFINPQTEDFGITMVEAMASGIPVIAYRSGGATEIVKENVSGVFFDEQTWESLADTVIRLKFANYNPVLIREHAQQFDTSVFQTKIKSFMDEKFQQQFKQK